MSIDPNAVIEEETTQIKQETYMEKALRIAVEDRRAIVFPEGAEFTDEQRAEREEQLERYEENYAKRLDASSRDSAAGDVLLHQPEASNFGWGSLFAWLFAKFTRIPAGTNTPLDRAAREHDGDTRFGRLTVGDKPAAAPEAAEPIVTTELGPPPRGLDGAQEDLQREFPEAAANRTANLDHAPAPALSTTLNG